MRKDKYRSDAWDEEWQTLETLANASGYEPSYEAQELAEAAFKAGFEAGVEYYRKEILEL